MRWILSAIVVVMPLACGGCAWGPCGPAFCIPFQKASDPPPTTTEPTQLVRPSNVVPPTQGLPETNIAP